MKKKLKGFKRMSSFYKWGISLDLSKNEARQQNIAAQPIESNHEEPETDLHFSNLYN